MTEQSPMMPTPEHVRAARAWFGLSQQEFAELSGVPKRTLARFEMGEGMQHQATLEKLKTGLVKLGVHPLFAGRTPSGIEIIQEGFEC